MAQLAETKVIDYFNTHNCCQSVLRTILEEKGLMFDEAVSVCSGFGGGIAVGNARKVVELVDGNVLESLEKDDVLVLPYETAFHYADWHSLLTVIKAVVSPGTPSHHLAQIARECGVPLAGHMTGDLNEIPENIHVKLVIFDILGREIKVLEDTYVYAGIHEAVWSGKNQYGEIVGNGVYIYQIQAGEYTKSNKMILIR